MAEHPDSPPTAVPLFVVHHFATIAPSVVLVLVSFLTRIRPRASNFIAMEGRSLMYGKFSLPALLAGAVLVVFPSATAFARDHGGGHGYSGGRSYSGGGGYSGGRGYSGGHGHSGGRAYSGGHG